MDCEFYTTKLHFLNSSFLHYRQNSILSAFYFFIRLKTLMKHNCAIGIDIGDSHISCAAVDTVSLKIIHKKQTKT